MLNSIDKRELSSFRFQVTTPAVQPRVRIESSAANIYNPTAIYLYCTLTIKYLTDSNQI